MSENRMLDNWTRGGGMKQDLKPSKAEVAAAYACADHGESCFTCKDCRIAELKRELAEAKELIGQWEISSLNILKRAEKAEQQLSDSEHLLQRYEESEKSLAEELRLTLLRTEKAEAELAAYREGVEVEEEPMSLYDKHGCISGAYVEVAVPKEWLGERVLVNVSAQVRRG